jgi:hypothetical protein
MGKFIKSIASRRFVLVESLGGVFFTVIPGVSTALFNSSCKDRGLSIGVAGETISSGNLLGGQGVEILSGKNWVFGDIV